MCGDKDEQGGVTLPMIGLGGGSLAFPRSCQIMQQLRLEDALAAGKPLLRAVGDDLRQTLAPAAITTLTNSSAWGALAVQALAIVNRAIDRKSFSVLDVEATFDIFLDAMPFVRAMPLLDGKALAALENEIGIIQKCEKAKVAECGRNAIALLDINAIKTLLGTLQTTHADVLDALAELDTIGGHLLTALQSYSVSPDLFDQCKTGPTEVRTDLAKCVKYIVRTWTSPEGAVRMFEHVLDDKAKRDALERIFLDTVVEHFLHIEPDKRTTRAKQIVHVVQVACTARLAVGIVRRCTGDSCTNDDIKDMFKNPGNYFAFDDNKLVDHVCWVSNTYRLVPTEEHVIFEGVVADGLELITDTQKQTPSARGAAVLRTVTRIGTELMGCTGDAASITNCRELASTSDLLVALLEEDHTKALTAVTQLVHLIASKVPIGLSRGVQLIGTVAAYAQVFEQTKNQDAATATTARKKALESLIDAATDRHGRAGNWVFSLGSNVGLGYVWSAPNAADPDTMTAGNPNDRSYTPQLRVPIGFALDKLPSGWNICPNHWGAHFGATLGDLGQFAATDHDGKLQKVRWDNFISPGLELGFIIGDPQQAVNISLHAEYTPTLYQTATEGGAWRVGLSLGYYVPLFDLN